MRGATESRGSGRKRVENAQNYGQNALFRRFRTPFEDSGEAPAVTELVGDEVDQEDGSESPKGERGDLGEEGGRTVLEGLVEAEEPDRREPADEDGPGEAGGQERKKGDQQSAAKP